MPIDDIGKLCDQLIGGMQQRTFISVQEIMAAYSIKERLLRQKSLLMKQMTLEEVFKKAVSRSAAELENPVPGPMMMVIITTMTPLIYFFLGIWWGRAGCGATASSALKVQVADEWVDQILLSWPVLLRKVLVCLSTLKARPGS